MKPTRAGRILRRTLSGGALVLAVAGLLFWVGRTSDGRPILYATAAVLIGTILETTRMGALAMRDLMPALLLPAAGVLLLVSSAIDGRGPAGLAQLYALSAGLAAGAHCLARALPRPIAGLALLSRSLVYLAIGVVLVLAMPEPQTGRSNWGLAGLVLAGILAATLVPAIRRPGGTRGLLIAVGLAVWIVPPLPALWHVWRAWSTGGLVAFLLCAKIGDTAGYYLGTMFGRRHPFPRISPGKTVEGCLGSFAAGTAAGGAAVSLGLLPGALAGGLAAGAIVNLASQAGDLLESWVKRKAGVKDSSSVFGPSGGLLDQIDSLLLSVPLALASWPWLLGTPAGSH